MTPQPLAGLSSLKVKLGVLVAASVTVAAVVGTVGRVAGVAVWLSIPVTIALALALTQLLAVGMVAPLRQMTAAARRMATGDYAVRVEASSRDEVGELARAFNTMARDLADVDRQRRELVANVSHELRTPLAGLTAVLENLADGVAPPSPEYLAAPLAQADRMGHLVEDLLDLARVDAGRAPLAPEPVAVAPLLADAVAEPRGDGRAVHFDVRVEPEDLVVRADPARLHQLVANLLDNAARHSPAGGTVRVTAGRLGDSWRLEVGDDGPGVEPADRHRVFERFGTLGAPAPAGGGTGLGLAIAHWVTDLHRGSIAFVDPDPHPGHGSTGALVRVVLPLSPPDRPGLPQEDPVPTPLPTNTPAADPTPAPAVVPARPLLDDLFGSFWPPRAVPAQPGLLLGAVGVGILAGVVLPFRDLGLALTLVLLAAGAVVLTASKDRRDPFVIAAAFGCGLLALTPALRAAEWIVVLSLLAGAALCLIAVTRGRTLPGFVMAGVSWPLAGLRGLPWLGRTLGSLTGLGRQAAVLRTVAWSLLALVVFGALLSSADAVLGEWVDALVPDLRVDTAVARVFIAVAVGGAVLAAAYLALDPPQVERDRRPTPAARRYEWLAPVLVVNAVFAAFLVAQATVIFGGHDYLRRTTGLTYADYVHQGFGQLTVATALTLLVVALAARKAATTDRVWMLGALGLLLAQTLVVVASALHRVDLYQEAYGFTRLRLLVIVFEGWLGLLVLTVMVAGLAARGAWLPRFAVLSGTVALLGLAVLNPDAWIADRNLDRYAETGKVDWEYLQGLSDDAVPTIAERPREQAACALGDRPPRDDDWLEWNLGRSRATEALETLPPASVRIQQTCPDGS